MNSYVMYVDDEDANLVVFEAGLKGTVPVLTAKSGEQALKLMQLHEVAVLLTDQRMPGMTGVELMAAVARDFPDTIRILITAYSDIDAAIGAINEGRVAGYLHKPWNPAELKLVLVQARERYETKKQLQELEKRFINTERMYALGVIAAGVAHEIRSPLTSLSMNIELLSALTQEPSLDGEQRAQLKAAMSDADQAVRAIIDITNSIELSTRSRTDGDVDMREVVELAARSVKGESRRKGRVELHLAPVPTVRGVRTRLGQVVLNLLVNALEALETEQRARNLVTVRLKHREGTLELAVEDNGPGISPEVVGRVFDPFFTTKGEGGTGLGLAISLQIVHEHGGSLEVSSTVGQGTRFVVRLPVVETAKW